MHPAEIHVFTKVNHFKQNMSLEKLHGAMNRKSWTLFCYPWQLADMCDLGSSLIVSTEATETKPKMFQACTETWQ